jgi:hypothetical protein
MATKTLLEKREERTVSLPIKFNKYVGSDETTKRTID